MASFRLEIDYDSSVARDGSVPLTARVINNDTDEEVTNNVSYQWSIVGTGTFSGQNQHIFTYNADGFGVNDVPASVSVTCRATITDITPDASEISTTVLTSLGVTNIDVNMHMMANRIGDFLYNGETDSVLQGSDTNFYKRYFERLSNPMETFGHRIISISDKPRPIRLRFNDNDEDVLDSRWESANKISLHHCA